MKRKLAATLAGIVVLCGISVSNVGCDSNVKAAMMPSIESGMTSLLTGAVEGLVAMVYPDGEESDS